MTLPSNRLQKWLAATATLVVALAIVIIGLPLPALALSGGPAAGAVVASIPPTATQASGWIIGSSPVANFGVILHTTNDGQLWDRQGSTLDIPNTGLNNVKAVDRDTAWVVGDSTGDYGVILRTTDAGSTWVRKGSAATIPNQDIYGVAAVSRDTAWVVGTNGTILRTDDGGDSWGLQPSGTTATLVEVAAVDSQTAWAVGDDNSTWGVILHTTDGGATWQRQALLECDRPCIDLTVLDANTAWTVGNHGLVLKTTDGGAHWTPQMKYTDADNNGTCAVDGNTAWIAADAGTMYRTDNGGSAWNMLNDATLPGGYYLLGVSGLGPQTAWVVGGGASFPYGGVILHTTDAGATWDRQTTPVEVTLRRVSMVKPPPPSDPYSVTYGPVSGGTRVQWAGSLGASAYLVYSEGRLIGTTGASASSLFVSTLLGPRSAISVVAQDSYGSTSAAVPGVYKRVSPVRIGVVYFTPNSSRLTTSGKRKLRGFAALLKAQGFTSLRVDGYTAKRDHGSSSFRKRLSLKRARNVRAYLAAESRRLHYKITVTAVGHGGASPVGANSSAAGAAKNRRAELVLR